MNFKVYRFIFAMAFCSIVHGQSERTSPCSESELEKIRVSSQACLTEGLQQVDPSSDSNPVSQNISEIFSLDATFNFSLTLTNKYFFSAKMFWDIIFKHP